jgi:hypothetical protein
VWQTYDYYFEPTAAYFGSKKACEPLHIQWNPLSDSIEVVNYSVPGRPPLTAEMVTLNPDGTFRSRNQAIIICPVDSIYPCFAVGDKEDSASISVLRLTLRREGIIVSENCYWRGLEQSNRKGDRRVLSLNLDAVTRTSHDRGTWHLRSTVTNHTKHAALTAALSVVGEKSGERILPAFYEDNYFSLLPGESRTVAVDVRERDSRGERPSVRVDGMGVE